MGAPTHFVLVVRAHLPWVPPADDDDGPDARALYDLVTDRLLPLLAILEGLVDEGVPFKVTLAPSPTLLALLSDDWARAAIVRRSERMRRLATLEADRYEGSVWGPLGEWYEDRLLATNERLSDPAAGDIVASLGRLAESGCVVLAPPPEPANPVHPHGPWRDAQARAAAADLSTRFGTPASDSAAAPVSAALEDLGALGRDPVYRDPAADIAWERALPYLRPFVAVGPERTPTGISYRRYEQEHEQASDKAQPAGGKIWVPDAARVRADEQAFECLASLADRGPVVAAGFDLSLPGWYEMPWFLETLMRGLAEGGTAAVASSVADVERAGLKMPASRPIDDPLAAHLSPPCDWIQRHLAEIRARMEAVVIPAAAGLHARAARQASREALLAHAGDWPQRMLQSGRRSEVNGRFADHVRGFLQLADGIATGSVDEPLLDELELINPVFPHLDVASAFTS